MLSYAFLTFLILYRNGFPPMSNSKSIIDRRIIVGLRFGVGGCIVLGLLWLINWATLPIRADAAPAGVEKVMALAGATPEALVGPVTVALSPALPQSYAKAFVTVLKRTPSL